MKIFKGEINGITYICNAETREQAVSLFIEEESINGEQVKEIDFKVIEEIPEKDWPFYTISHEDDEPGEEPWTFKRFIDDGNKPQVFSSSEW
jgi:hypothetical protein